MAQSKGVINSKKPSTAELQSRLKELEDTVKVYRDAQFTLSIMTERTTNINQISKELNTLEIDKISEVAVKRIAPLLGAKYASFFLYDYDNDELILKSHNHPDELTQRIVIKLHKNTIMGLAISRRKIIHIVDIEEFERDNKVKLERTFADKYATRTCICIPLVAANHIVGVLNFADKDDGSYFDEVSDLPTAEQLGNVMSLAIWNHLLFEEVQKQARTDGLTKLSNYRAFHEQLRKEIHRSVRYGRPLSLIMFDVDHFKGINDVYGHQAGDFVLAELGNVVRSAVRREDFPARYGGDEIAVILAETTLSGALIVAGRMMATTRTTKFAYKNDNIKVTLSMGIAAFSGNMNVTDFISAADSALYEAKQKGRDRYEIANLKPAEQQQK